MRCIPQTRLFYNSQMCLSSRKANFVKSHITHDTESMHATFVCMCALYIYFNPKNLCGMAVTFETEPLRREGASDSFSLLSQTRELYILYLYSCLSLTLSSVLGCHYICNLMLRYCFYSLLGSLPSCLRKNNQKFHFENENPTNS